MARGIMGKVSAAAVRVEMEEVEGRGGGRGERRRGWRVRGSYAS
jgi:hypothetical protein